MVGPLGLGFENSDLEANLNQMDPQAADYDDLERSTQAFLDLHYPSHLGSRPEWSEPWQFKGPIPNRDEKGCYAFFNIDNELIYIGLGIGQNGQGLYSGAGLGSRLSRIWRKVSPGYYEQNPGY